MRGDLEISHNSASSCHCVAICPCGKKCSAMGRKEATSVVTFGMSPRHFTDALRSTAYISTAFTVDCVQPSPRPPVSRNDVWRTHRTANLFGTSAPQRIHYWHSHIEKLAAISNHTNNGRRDHCTPRSTFSLLLRPRPHCGHGGISFRTSLALENPLPRATSELH